MSGIFIVGARRTPFGTFGGKLKAISATDLAVHAAKAAIADSKLSADKIEDVWVGNVIQSSLDAPYMGRHVGLKSGAPVSTPGLTINRLCGSGFETVCLGAESIKLGRTSVNLCAGAENMSATPMCIDGLTARFGAGLGKGMKAEDALWAGLTDSLSGMPMGMTAEKVGAKYGITREQCDEYGMRSQELWAKANDAGVFAAEIAPIEVKGKKGKEMMTTDEHPRKTTVADLGKLKPVFKEGGIVTAGSASGISDGAGAIVLASEAAVKANGLTPLVRVVAWARTGCDPTIMGIGPVEAMRTALKHANLTLQDMDIIELNEAFAAQYLACEKELGVDRNKANLCGGAIAIGHPLGATGSRVLAHLAHELSRSNKKYGIGSACIGGGMGIAVILEKA